MDMYSATDGVPGDFHLVHLGARALGGAGLVMSEMVCVSAEGRITPGCAGLYTDRQAEAWQRVTAFAHSQAPGTALGVQLGHSGRKGSTKLMWEAVHGSEPLEEGNWPLVAASPIPYGPRSQTPRELTLTQLEVIRAEFTAAERRAARAASTFSNSTAPTGTCSQVSSPRSPITARTPTAVRSPPGSVSPSKSSTP